MLRRKPTVIELRLDTDKAEYEQILRERQLQGGNPLPVPQVGTRPVLHEDARSRTFCC